MVLSMKLKRKHSEEDWQINMGITGRKICHTTRRTIMGRWRAITLHWNDTKLQWTVLLDKLTVKQLIKKFPTLCETGNFNTMFTTACHLSLSKASLRWDTESKVIWGRVFGLSKQFLYLSVQCENVMPWYQKMKLLCISMCGLYHSFTASMTNVL